MILPNNERCAQVVELLKDDPALSEWERQFIGSNLARVQFSDPQKQVIARLLEKYEV